MMTDGILLIGYGTRKGNLLEVLNSQAARIAAATQYEVGIGCFRVSNPTIMEGIEGLISKGVDRIAAVPYFVADGTITHELIPAKMGLDPHVYLGEVKTPSGEAKVYITRSFNFDNVITDILCDKIQKAGGSRRSGVIILGHGTRDPTLLNREVIAKNAERLFCRGYEHTTFAFNEFCEPTIKDAIGKLVSQDVDEIVCIPLFIAMGLHLGDEIPEQIGIPPFSEGGEITFEGKKIKIMYTRPLEDDPRLAELAISKAEEYLGE